MKTMPLTPVPETLGERVSELRKYHGLTQIEVCRIAKIKQPSLSDIENNVTKVEDLKARTLVGLARALKADAEYLLHGTGDTLQFHLMTLYRALSEDGRDELLGKANRIYSREHPNDLSAHPYGAAQKAKHHIKEKA